MTIRLKIPRSIQTGHALSHMLCRDIRTRGNRHETSVNRIQVRRRSQFNHDRMNHIAHFKFLAEKRAKKRDTEKKGDETVHALFFKN